MKSTISADDDLIEFQIGLGQSIRRAWVLAFAIAIPGALLLTLWFPHSSQAFLAVAVLGVAIGVISDAIEHAKKRRLQEIEQITRALHEAVQEVTRLIEERIGGGVLIREGASLTAQEAEIEAIVERAMSKNPLIVEEMKSINATLLMIRQELVASRSHPLSWDAMR